MDWSFSFFTLSITLGAGLAMDAFSVSLANGLNDTKMKLGRMCGIAAMFAFFQALMPTLGWLCVSTVAEQFKAFERFIPWIALVLLSWIGGKMLFEGIRCAMRKEQNPENNGIDGTNGSDGSDGKDCPCCAKRLTLGALVVQGIATSIDALSVGFTIPDYDLAHALVCALVIAAVTFVICMGGLSIGKTFGTMLSNAASILGGSILIVIGVWILVKSFL